MLKTLPPPESSPPIRDFNIKNRAPSPMTLACVASNRAAPPLHPQLPQLITSQRALFSHCKLPKNSYAQGPSMVPASNPSGCALSLHMLLPLRLQSLKPLPGQTRKFSHIQMQFSCFPPALGAQPQACPAITAAVARLHARLQAADFWAWKFLSRSFLSRTRIIIKQADSRKTIHPAMQSLSQLEFALSPSWPKKDAGCTGRLARQGWFNGMGPLPAAQTLTNISKSDQKAKERCLNLSSKKLEPKWLQVVTTRWNPSFAPHHLKSPWKRHQKVTVNLWKQKTYYIVIFIMNWRSTVCTFCIIYNPTPPKKQLHY